MVELLGTYHHFGLNKDEKAALGRVTIDGKTILFNKETGELYGKGQSKPDRWGGLDITVHSLSKEELDKALIAIARLPENQRPKLIEIPKGDKPNKPRFFGDFQTYSLPSNYSIISVGDFKVLAISADRKTAFFIVQDERPYDKYMLVKLPSDDELKRIKSSTP